MLFANRRQAREPITRLGSEKQTNWPGESQWAAVTARYDRMRRSYAISYANRIGVQPLFLPYTGVATNALRQSPTNIERGVPVGDDSWRTAREWQRCLNSERVRVMEESVHA